MIKFNCFANTTSITFSNKIKTRSFIHSSQKMPSKSQNYQRPQFIVTVLLLSLNFSTSPKMLSDSYLSFASTDILRERGDAVCINWCIIIMKIKSSHFKKEFDLHKAELIGEGNFAQVLPSRVRCIECLIANSKTPLPFAK